MKRLLTILAFLLLAAPAMAEEPLQLARMSGPMLGSGGGAVVTSCTKATIQQSETGQNGGFAVGYSSGNTWYASQVTYGGTTGALCDITIDTCRAGTPDGTVSVYLYSDSGSNAPSAQLASCGTIVVSDVASCYSYTARSATCTGDYSITNGTKYWIVLKYNGTEDTVNFPRWTYDSDCTTELTKSSEAGSSWNSEYSDKCGNYKLYIKE